MSQKVPWMDRFGTLASAACALHCLVLSTAPALFAALGLELLHNELFEWGFFAMAMAFASLAAIFGFRLHRNSRVLGWFVVGGLVLMAGRFGEAGGLFEGAGILAIIGGFLLVISHVLNASCTRKCQQDSTPS